MSFVDKVAAIRRTLGLNEEAVPLPLAIAKAMEMMGVAPDPLTLETYGGGDVGSWVLLEETGEESE